MADVRAKGIRPMEPNDIPQVARLVEHMTHSRSAHDLERILEQTLFAEAWSDPDIPSFVYVDDGKIRGTIAASLRRARFDGRPARMVCSSLLYAQPSVRDRGVGAQLLRALLSGPQDITIADRATDTVRLLWEALGGRTVGLGCLSFVRIFKPWRVGAVRLAQKRPNSALLNSLTQLAGPLDFATGRVARSFLEPPEPGADVELLTPAKAVENFAAVTPQVRFHPDYDEAYLEWLYGELDGLEPRGHRWGELVKRNGRPVGWYVALFQPSGSYRVLQIAARPKHVQTVLEQLFRGAWAREASAVVGRLESNLVPALHRIGGPIVYMQTERMLIHARDRELLNAVLAGDAFLTRLDGEW